jgi:protein-S-isoprenylcysteine O-methyltransferase Ste14
VKIPSLGRRGEGWVVLQFLLIGNVAFAAAVDRPWPDAVATPLWWIGIASVGAGAVLFVRAVRDLGTSLTAFPKPHGTSTLRTGGIYASVRHPIYGGLVLLALGWSLMHAPMALAPTALLAVVLDLKSRREETFLEERYPDYAAYRKRVPRRLFPGPR